MLDLNADKPVRPAHRLDFAAINRAALASLPALLARWLPDGRRRGDEYLARNPRRADRRPGSFSVNLGTDRWATVGQCCRRRLAEVHGFGITVTGGPPSVYADMAERAGLGGRPIYAIAADGPGVPWRASDRAWFAAHPDRSHRARCPLPGELEAHGLDPVEQAAAWHRRAEPLPYTREAGAGP